MALRTESIHGQWSSRWAFILAAVGSAVGLGNIWKFPYVVSENGGAAFVLVYLLCVFLVGIPIMMSEVLLGRRGRQNPVDTMASLAEEAGKPKGWRFVGWSGIAAGFIILSFYSVIAGWTLAYVIRTISGTFSGASPELVDQTFGSLLASPGELIFWHTLFLGLTLLVVIRGVSGGIERAAKLLMPSLFVLLLIMVFYAMSSGGFGQAVNFLFSADFSKITAEGVLIALGQAFFSLSLGMGAIMVYGSYLPKGTSIAKTSIIIALMDTLVALMAGLAIFPIVFANGLEGGAIQSVGLIFNTLPIAFGQMTAGTLFGTLFFILLVFAAWTSAISLIEPAVTWLVENKNLTRKKAVLISGAIIWLLGLGTVFSFNIWSDYKLFGLNFFENLDFLASNIMLPLGGLAIAVFAGWMMAKSSTREELQIENETLYNVWLFLVRVVAPAAVTFVFLKAIGLL